MKLASAPTYPITYSPGMATNMVLNLTPDGKYQAARVLNPGASSEADFEVLFEGTLQECDAALQNMTHQEFPGLI